ncbi:MAG: MFS transporter [Alteromonadaceae bacterium]|nr:MFS transporter [Alteromonadaceae bacterium]
MSNNNNNVGDKVFLLSCIALTVTAMTFAIRAGILGELGAQYGLSSEQLGWMNAMAFLGFPLATMFGGVLYNAFGAKKLITAAFVCHLLGLVMTITADGFWGLLISTFLVGFANGAVEAGCNPLIAETHKDNKTTMLNKFHVWFPGGIVIGSLVSTGLSSMSYGWQVQVAAIILPTLVYGYMLFTTEFPVLDSKDHSTLSNVKSLFSPIYLFLIVCMTLTATTELGTQQWIQNILGASGATPMLILALITGIMAVGRYFAGPIVHKLNPAGVLVFSAIFSTLGIYLMSVVSGPMVYVAAVCFAFGVTYFWPTMLGCVSEYTPKTGAMGLSLIGGAGMFAVSMWNPVIGSWIDNATAQAQTLNLSETEVQIAAGQAVLENLLVFPIILIVAFIGFYVFLNRGKKAMTQEAA